MVLDVGAAFVVLPASAVQGWTHQGHLELAALLMPIALSPLHMSPQLCSIKYLVASYSLYNGTGTAV